MWVTRVGLVSQRSFSPSRFCFLSVITCVTSTQKFVFCLRSRQLELEDKQSALELELRKYMEITGVYC